MLSNQLERVISNNVDMINKINKIKGNLRKIAGLTRERNSYQMQCNLKDLNVRANLLPRHFLVQ